MNAVRWFRRDPGHETPTPDTGELLRTFLRWLIVTLISALGG